MVFGDVEAVFVHVGVGIWIKLAGGMPIDGLISGMRAKTLLPLVTVLLCGALVPSASARVAKPVIKGEEVGYFGSATVAYQLDVFVYSNVSPRSGGHVTVCVNGKCERAFGHRRPAPWYSASFSTRGLRMGDAVRFTVMESDAAGQSKVTVTRPLLCMHNNGSTPQN